MTDNTTPTLPTMDNEEAKNKILAGEKLQGVYIERLTLSKREIEQAIHMVECEITHLDLNKSTLREEILLRRCNIANLVLSDAIFEKKFDFKRSRVGRGRIQRATFKNGVNFDSAHLAHTSFHQSDFSGKAEFSRCAFYGEATFSEAKFHGEAKFTTSQFASKAVFRNTQWDAKVDFRNIDVGNDLELSGSAFAAELLLIGAVIRLSLDLSHSRLQGQTDFGHATIGRILSLNRVKLGDKQSFRFLNVSASSIVIEREIVEGHIYPEREGKYLLASKEYGFLRNTFEDINRFDDEDWAYYQFKRMERIGQPFSANPLQQLKRMFEYLFLDLGCGYGTKPFRTLVAGGSLILLFAACYFLYFANASVGDYGFSSNLLNRIFYALDISLVAFSSYGDLTIKGPIRMLAMFEYLFGIVFMGLFVVAFSRKVIR